MAKRIVEKSKVEVCSFSSEAVILPSVYSTKDTKASWSTEVPDMQQLITQVHNQQASFQHQEQKQQESPRQLEGEQVTQAQKGEEHDQHGQQKSTEFQKFNVEQLPQPVLSGRGQKHKDIEDIAKVKNSMFENSLSKKTKNLPESNDDKLGADTQAQELKMPQVESSYPLFVAKYDYAQQTDEDLGFKKGDLLYIVDMSDGDWWLAKAKKSGQEGYIPNNLVAEVNSLEAEDWFFGAISSVEADNQLMQPCNDCGSFLIRGSKSNGYSLSVRDTEKVRHYKIERSHDGAFFVTQLISFETLSDLITHYKQEADGLCVTLKNACLIAEPPQIDEDWEIDRNSISLVKKLGDGQFGEMWMGIWNGTTEVAVKALKPGTIGASEFLKEASVMKNLRHPSLVQLYGTCTKQEPVYIITELMKLGSLLGYLKADGRSLKLPQLIDMGAQVASGMAYLEWKNYVHRDLSAKNILVGENLVCKVGSFRSARVIDEDINEAYTKENFPIKWAAPEVVMYSRFTIKSDVWSFGILLYELITYGCSPYPGMNDAQVLEALQTGYHMPSPMGCPEQLYEIMKECWRDDAASRPTFGTLQLKLEEFFFTSV